MRVLVAVHVCELDARALQTNHLCGGFAFYVFGTDAAGKDGAEEFSESWVEGSVAGTQKRRDFGCGRDGSAIQQNDVAADGEV